MGNCLVFSFPTYEGVFVSLMEAVDCKEKLPCLVWLKRQMWSLGFV
jgi:hypothetical protein